jgi:imidazoleglycerol-phosphate dehydratase
LINQRGSNKHHILESVFKAFAVSLKRALQESKNAGIPSTKGIL